MYIFSHTLLNSGLSEGADHFSFSSISSPRFSLSSSQCSSSVQRSPPTRSRTDRVQHIQGSRSASPHPGLRRVSQPRLFYFFFFFLLLGPVLFVIPPSFHPSPTPQSLTPTTCSGFPPPPPIYLSNTPMRRQVLSVSARSQRSDACQAGSPHSTAHYPLQPPPPTTPTHASPPSLSQHAESTDRPSDRPTDRHSSESCFPFCTHSWEIWTPAAVVSLSKGCRSSEEWEGLFLNP